MAQTIEVIYGLIRVMYSGYMHPTFRLLVVDLLSSRRQGDWWAVFEDPSIRSADNNEAVSVALMTF